MNAILVGLAICIFGPLVLGALCACFASSSWSASERMAEGKDQVEPTKSDCGFQQKGLAPVPAIGRAAGAVIPLSAPANFPHAK